MLLLHHRSIIVTLLLVALASPAAAEPSVGSVAPVDLATALAETDSLLEVGDYEEANARLEALVVLHPTDVEVRWRLGKAIVDFAKADGDGDEKLQKAQYARAVLELREAVRLDPNHRDAVFNLAIAVGREGLVNGSRAKVRASREVKALAERTIEIDPDFDGAYHLLGRWHREIKSLGFFTRSLVRVVYGGFPDASYEEALRLFERAHELRPRMAHLLEMGICHEALGDHEAARDIFRQVIAMQSDHADAWMMRAEAQRRL